MLFSGGRDSTCLLDLAVRLAGPVTALHVNYGLRPDADADEAHCAALCERLGVPLEVRRAGPPRGNVQAWARELRYAEADKLDGTIAVGHTATDQAETVLYRLVASPGRRALLGMEPRSGRVVRPLLGVTRAETAAYCREHGLEWREDPTQRGIRARTDPRAARAAPGGRGECRRARSRSCATRPPCSTSPSTRRSTPTSRRSRRRSRGSCSSGWRARRRSPPTPTRSSTWRARAGRRISICPAACGRRPSTDG